MRNLLVVLLFLASSSAANAEEAASPWTGSAALGILATSGNSETTSSNLGVALNHTGELWRHEAAALAAGADTSGVTTAERYKATYKVKRDFTEFDYLYGLIGYEKDKFSGYDQQTTESVGYGRRVINEENQVLNVEAGAGFKQSDLRDNTSQKGAILRVGGDYLWKFSPMAQFSQVLSVEQGSGNTYLEATSAIKATLMEQLGLVLSYTAKNNSDVPAGNKKTDTFTAISLEYGF